MTKRLIVLRHAKATHKPGFADAERPLTERGVRDADAAGAWLRARQIVPDLVLCSPSRRTRETWGRVALALGVNGPWAVNGPGAVNGAGAVNRSGEPNGTEAVNGTEAASGTEAAGAHDGAIDGTGAGDSIEVRYDSRLYLADTDEVLEIIADDPGEADTVLLVGHNPVALQIVCRLAARSDLEFPTSALAIVGLDDWNRLAPGTGMIESLWTPKSERV